MDFNNEIISLKKLLAKKGISPVFEKLNELVNPNSKQFDFLILLASEHKALNNNIIAGILDYTNEALHLSKIRGRLIMLINDLEIDDMVFISNPNSQIDNQLEWGYKELPLNLLHSLNKLTPEIVSEREIQIKYTLDAHRKKISEANKEKQFRCDKIIKKVISMIISGEFSERLHKKYSREFNDANKSFDKQISNLSDIYNSLGNEIPAIIIYKIEILFQKVKISDKEKEELYIFLENICRKNNELISTIDNAIKAFFTIRDQFTTDFLSYKSVMERSIEHHTNLKKSVLVCNEQLQTLKKGIEFLV